MVREIPKTVPQKQGTLLSPKWVADQFKNSVLTFPQKADTSNMKYSNRPNSKADKERGFTLLELIIVIVILGVLAAIAIPIYGSQQRSAVIATVKSDIRSSVPVALKQMSNTLEYLNADEFAAVAAMSDKNNVVLLVNGEGFGTVACIWGSRVFGDNDTVSYHYSSETGKIAEGGCLGDYPDDAVVIVGTGPTVDDPSTAVDEVAAEEALPDEMGPPELGSSKGNKYPVCHGDTGSWHLLMLPLSAIANGHNGHGADIIPPIAGKYAGKNWDANGWNNFIKYCS